jgi:hypothetical protein
MSAIVSESAVANAFGGTFISLQTTPGRLKTLTAFPTTQSLEPNSVFIEIGICTGAADFIHRTAVLGSGYCGDPGAIFWSGDVLLGEDDLLYANCFAYDTISCRLCAKVER